MTSSSPDLATLALLVGEIAVTIDPQCEGSQPREDVRPTLSAVEQALDALERAFHPELDRRVHHEQRSQRDGVGLGNSITQRFADCETRSPDGDGRRDKSGQKDARNSQRADSESEPIRLRARQPQAGSDVADTTRVPVAGSEPAESQPQLGNSITQGIA